PRRTCKKGPRDRERLSLQDILAPSHGREGAFRMSSRTVAKGGGLQDRTCWPAGQTGPPEHRGRSSNRLSQGGITLMHNRMTRILSAISLLVVIPTMAFASSSRVSVIGAVLGNLREGRMGTWGLPLREFSPALAQSMSGNSVTTTGVAGFSDPNTNGEALDLMWGHKMGSGNLGLRYSRS